MQRMHNPGLVALKTVLVAKEAPLTGAWTDNGADDARWSRGVARPITLGRHYRLTGMVGSKDLAAQRGSAIAASMPQSPRTWPFDFIGSRALAQDPHVPQQGVEHAGVDVKYLFRLALWATDWDEDSDARTEVALVGERRQAVGRRLVQRGQSVNADRGDVGCGSGFDVGDPQRGAVRGRQKLDFAAERLVLLAEPQVVAVLADVGEVVRFDPRAVEDHVRHAPALTPVQDLVQVRSLVGEDVDALLQVAVSGGLGDAGVADPGSARNCARGTSPTPTPPARTGPAPGISGLLGSSRRPVRCIARRSIALVLDVLG